MFNFGNKTFEERKDSLEQGMCTCFPDNPEHEQCLKNCKYRKAVVEKMETEEEEINETSESQK